MSDGGLSRSASEAGFQDGDMQQTSQHDTDETTGTLSAGDADERGSAVSLATGLHSLGSGPPRSISTSRVDRLLLQRLKRSKSQTLLWGDAAPPLPAPALASQGSGGLGGPNGPGAPLPPPPPAPFGGNFGGNSQPASSGGIPQLRTASATDPSERSAPTSGFSRTEARESPGETGASVPYMPTDGNGVNDAAQQRLLVVANRLPVSAYRDKQGHWQFEVSAGGLVSALMGVHNFRATWIGWPGVYVEEGSDRDSLTAALSKEGYIPVYLDEKTVDLHYNGFCNSVLWALFHYVPLNIETKLSETRTLQFQWAAYQDANRKFAEAVFDIYQEGDVVWAQDYHLMLLPAMLKKQHPKMKVGWFLHTPFPSSEIYRTLPVREEVLRAVLRADLIGFHTYDYARHFVSAGTRILGLEGTPEGVEDNGSLTRVAAFPIGIDPERFAAALEEDSVRASIAQLLNKYAGRKVMLGVDRLDMIKGIPQKLLAFEKFLEENPEWRDRVLLVQIAVPSRTDVPEYQRLRSMVHEIVGRINGRYGTLTENPIHHLDRQLSFHELCALYAVTDVALVTSLRDGMNLVSYEYVACQSDNAVPGVLVLSEFAGAAQSLGAGAILVNPWNITDMAAAIEDALTMSEQERRERHRQNYMHITIHTSQTWADTFISELNDTHVEAELRTRHIPPLLDVEDVVHEYQEARKRLLVFGYNATLTTGVESTPRQPKRHFDNLMSMARVNPQTYNSIKALTENPDTIVVIFSGSAKEQLEEVFGALNVWLAAENGIFMRPPPLHAEPKSEWVPLVDVKKKEWMEAVALVFDYFRERTPRSFVEAREASIVWNYKNADIEFGRLQARDLLQHLWTGPISNAPVDIVQGSKSVEVRPVGISKGIAMQSILHAMVEQGGPPAINFDFVLVVGHFLTRDENIFTFFEGQKMLEGKAGMAAALSVMGSSAVSLPALAGLPHSGPSLQRLSEAAEGSDFGSSILATGGDAPVVSPLAGAPGFVKAAAAATPAVTGPSAGPLASVAEHTNAAAAAAESGTAAGAASAFGSAGSAAEAAQGNGGASAADCEMSPTAKSAASASAVSASAGSQAVAPTDSRLDGSSNREPGAMSTGSISAGGTAISGVLPGLPFQIHTGAATSSSGGGAPPGAGSSRYSMLAAVPPGGVDLSSSAGPPSLRRDSMPAAVGWQGAPNLGRESYQSLGGASASAWTPGATPPSSVPPSPAAGSSAARAAFTSSDLPCLAPPCAAAAVQQQPPQQQHPPPPQPPPPSPGLPPRAQSVVEPSGHRHFDGFVGSMNTPGRSESLPLEAAAASMRRVESGLRASSALLPGPTTPTGTNVFFNADMDLPMKLPPDHLFSCTVGRQRSQARGFLPSSAEVGTLLAKLANRAV